jgi:beta-lactamase regulating signal transducer with metallopeptidase domain
VVAGLINRCLFWWNPAAWMLNKAMRDNLEYIADRKILEKGFNKKHYQYHLLRISQLTYSSSIVHHFNFSNLKKEKNEFFAHFWYKFGFVLPLNCAFVKKTREDGKV